MNIFNKIFGISTKNLYLGRLAKTEEVKFYGYSQYTTTYSSLIPNRYVLVKKTSDGKYKDQKDDSKYVLSSKSHRVDEIGVTDLEPIVRENNRISYKDANALLEEKNILNKELSTENLYLAQLATYSSIVGNDRHFKKSNPPKYVLARKMFDDFNSMIYKDLFTNTQYHQYSYYAVKQGDVVVHSLEPIISDKQTITYYDADKILKTKNSVYIKK